jgi:hypothetical protein
MYKDKQCDAYLIDFNRDGKMEVLFISQQDYARTSLMMQTASGSWEIVGSLDGIFLKCRMEIQKALAAGAYRLVPPSIQDLEVAGQRIHVTPSQAASGECQP